MVAFGLFKILQQVKPITDRLKLSPSYYISPSFNVFLIKPAHESPNDATTNVAPLPPLDIQGLVKGILDFRQRGCQHLLDWEGCARP